MKPAKAYPLGVSIFFLFFSLVITFIFICYFVECSQVTILPLTISYLFLFLFFFLNFIVNLDLMLSIEEEDEEFGDLRGENKNLLNILSHFYDYFNFLTKAVRFVIFPFLINYYETGYYSFRKKVCEYYLRLVKGKLEIFKNKCYLALAIIGVILAIGGVILYFMVRDKFGLDSPFSYFNYVIILLNIISIIEIYVNVGFFMSQIWKDCKRQRNPELVNLYFNYSNKIIYEKLIKSIEEFCQSRNELEKEVDKFKGQDLPGYCDFLEKLYESAKDNSEKHKLQNMMVNRFGLERRSISRPVNNDQEAPNSVEVVSINNEEDIYKVKTQDKIMDKKEQKKERKKLAKEIKDVSENTLAEPIRKLKDSLRKIKRLEAKGNDIVEERDEDLKKTICHIIWIFIKYIILLLAFLMVIFADFVVPIYTYTEKNNTTNITNTTDTITTDVSDNDNDNSTSKTSNFNTPARYAEEIFGLIFICIFNSAYTIILIYSINRRNYLSGDYLYGKQKNDNISLMKTISEVTGFSFSLIFCNMYFYTKITDYKMIFFEEMQMPDYEIKYGISIFMIAKLVLIFFSIIMFSCSEGFLGIFKSDLYKFNKSLKENK